VNIRSELLKPMPAAAEVRRTTGRTLKRAGLVAFLGLLIGVPCFIIYTRALPDKNVGHILYWIHDHIFLPIKGYTYTLFYPHSIGWWGMILTVAVLWVIAFLAMAPFIKEPHIFVLRKLVRGNSKHRILVKTCGILKKWKIHTTLVKEVTALERKKTLNLLMSTPTARNGVDEKVFTRLLNLTRLHIDLMLLPPVENGNRDYLDAAVCWSQGFLQIRAGLRKNPDSRRLKALDSRLADMLERIILPLFNYKDKDLVEGAMKKESGFDIPSIALDLQLLGEPKNTARLVFSTAERQAILDSVRRRVEHHYDIRPFLPEDETGIPIHAALHRLALSIAINASLLAENSSIGLGYMESLETLDFVLDSREPGNPQIETLQHIIPYPDPGHFHLLDQLAQEELQLYENSSNQSLLYKDGVITAADFELAQTILGTFNKKFWPHLFQKVGKNEKQTTK
jgi:hypothetical protein